MAYTFELPGLHHHFSAQKRAFLRASALIRAGHLAGLFAVTAGCVVLFGYAMGIEVLWRPISTNAAMHPLAAVSLVAGGLAVAMIRPFHIPRAAMAILLIVAALAFLRIVEVAFELSFLDPVTPFLETIAQERAKGMGVGYAWNSSLMFILVSAAFLLRYFGCSHASQIVGALALLPPLISAAGYGYGVDVFHGQMSPVTTFAGFFFAACPLLFSARSGIVRAISSPWDGGRLGRLQISVVGSVLFLGGYWLRNIPGASAAFYMPAFVIAAFIVSSFTIMCCAIVIESNDRKRRIAERTMSQLSLLDPLSGLYNRRFLREHEAAILAMAKRHRYKVSMLIFDIDHFKAVNDTHGHQAGDEVIVRVANTIKNRTRVSDIAVRYGGEELLVILFDTRLKAALQIAEDIRAAVEKIDFSDRHADLGTITVSAGAAEVWSSLTEAITLADQALYDAKKSGRNRVVAERTAAKPVMAAA